MSEVRVRFAPSPTGYVHIGGLRTALYNYLFARHEKGKFILRIEDTDRTRYVEGALENLIEVLQWAGLDYDEGVFLDENRNIYEKGQYGPYIQSDRVKEGIYDKHIKKLIDEDKAYYCFCTADRLNNLREQQKADGKMPKYDGLCRGISKEEAQKRVDAGEPHVVRLKLPANKDIQFNDAIKGHLSINTNDMDDQVLIKTDGFPTYHFAVVIDDHDMKITHVVRGDEWVSSTPKHVYLYEALGWEAPTYVHLPTVLGKDKKKLSKRNADVSVEDFKQKGYLRDALINYIALVGWSPETNQEILSHDELVKQFSFERVSRSGGVFDEDKLDWVNSHYIKELSDSELAAELKPYLVECGYISEDKSIEELEEIAATFKTSLNKFSEIVKQTDFIFADYQNGVFYDEVKENINSEDAKKVLTTLKVIVENEGMNEELAKSVMKRIQKETGIKGKSLFFPVRSALSGSEHGPEMVHIFMILGKEGILNRLNYVLENY
ncbi:glutamate--tRNA ligase [Helcococcus ovis]|uniref:glutamate--tRNA ligase n=1 Tax=Helcococcus ovis TaxID=72026 RepID=UPI00106F7960|nr:glutamate--tRNA ligase [Helcococcus ovis]TFF68869.1 glutamate--tRNA ligase [Helcococcus ovis]WNZ00700.1 glutamate--tRNA ligase [Helcococcus ovis]